MSSNNSKNGNSKKGNSSMPMIIIALAIILVIFFIYSTIISYRNYKKYSPFLRDSFSKTADASTWGRYSANTSGSVEPIKLILRG